MAVQSVFAAWLLLCVWTVAIVLNMVSMYLACEGHTSPVYGCTSGIAVGWLLTFKIQLQPTNESEAGK